jgi:hypothetical protein
MLAMRIVGGMCARKTLMVGMVKAGARRGRISMLFGVKEAQKDKMERIIKRRGKRSRKMNSKKSRKMRTKRPRLIREVLTLTATSQARRSRSRSRSKIRRRKMQLSWIQRSQIQRRNEENSQMQ